MWFVRVGFALLTQNVINSAVSRDQESFRYYALLLLILTAGSLLLHMVNRWLTELSKAQLENLFKQRLTAAILRKEYAAVSAVHSGEWMNRLTNDTVVAANACVEILPGLAGMGIKLLSALVMIVALEPRFAAVFLPAGLLTVLLTWLFRRVLKKLHKEVQASDGRLRIFLQERIGSLLVIRSYAAEAQTAAEAEAKMERHKAARMRKNRFSNLCNIGFGAAINGMYLLGVGWCGYGILTGTVTFGTLTAITQLIAQVQSPFANITGYLPRYFAMLASAERLMEAERFGEDDAEAKTVAEIGAFYQNELRSIGLEKADFTYYSAAEDTAALTREGMSPALRDLSLEIRKGEYIAFTGHSGCGKSTALKLMMCVYAPDSGERYYTDSTGKRFPLDGSWRRLFAYVPQGNALMNGTIREVVSFAAPEAAREEARLSRALRIACAEEFVSALDKGADTVLGERGSGLSEGQMQRLAIARAIFSGSPILLLDEATSALDAATEKQVLENLRSMTDRTVVIVTHRPAALTICDRVLEFSESGVWERDPG